MHAILFVFLLETRWKRIVFVGQRKAFVLRVSTTAGWGSSVGPVRVLRSLIKESFPSLVSPGILLRLALEFRVAGRF
jgi:hypothetical protein